MARHFIMKQTNPCRALRSLGVLGLMGAATAVHPAVVVLDTDLENALITERILLPGGGLVFSAEFGFETSEVVVDNAILDSVTLTLVDPIGGQVAVLATLDGAGLIEAPDSPGALVLDPGTIRFRTMEPPVASELGGWQAFTITVELPPELRDRSLEFFVDLLSNLDGVPSRAFVGATAVPEPGSAAVAVAMGLAGWCVWRRRGLAGR